MTLAWLVGALSLVVTAPLGLPVSRAIAAGGVLDVELDSAAVTPGTTVVLTARVYDATFSLDTATDTHVRLWFQAGSPNDIESPGNSPDLQCSTGSAGECTVSYVAALEGTDVICAVTGGPSSQCSEPVAAPELADRVDVVERIVSRDAGPVSNPSPSPSVDPNADPRPSPSPGSSANPDPSPSPAPSPSPDQSPSPVPSTDPSPSPSPVPSTDPSPSPSPVPSPSPLPSTAPSPSASLAGISMSTGVPDPTPSPEPTAPAAPDAGSPDPGPSDPGSSPDAMPAPTPAATRQPQATPSAAPMTALAPVTAPAPTLPVAPAPASEPAPTPDPSRDATPPITAWLPFPPGPASPGSQTGSDGETGSLPPGGPTSPDQGSAAVVDPAPSPAVDAAHAPGQPTGRDAFGLDIARQIVDAAVSQAIVQVATVVKPVAVATVATTFGFPLALMVAVLLFLLVQSRLDRRDPKLRAAPVQATEMTLEFEDEDIL